MESNLLQFFSHCRKELDAMVLEKVQRETAALIQPKWTEVTCKGEVITPIIMGGERFLSRRDTAKMLDVGFPTLWRWNNEGVLKSIKVGGRKVYYHYEDVLMLLRGEQKYE